MADQPGVAHEVAGIFRIGQGKRESLPVAGLPVEPQIKGLGKIILPVGRLIGNRAVEQFFPLLPFVLALEAEFLEDAIVLGFFSGRSPASSMAFPALVFLSS